MKKHLVLCVYVILMGACNLFEVRKTGDAVVLSDSVTTLDSATAKRDSVLVSDSIQQHKTPVADGTRDRDTAFLPPSTDVKTGTVQPEAVVRFAETLVGVPYVYASTDPKVGFDCSGFITYVFNHFKIAVPRSSVDFTNVGKPVPVSAAKRGDLILFTGTDSTEKFVGHMGLVTTESEDPLQFIHATSGKAKGVTVTPLNDYYKSRFVKVIRIFGE